MVTPECIGDLTQPSFGTLWGDEKGYRFGNRESMRACERGFDDFYESEAPTSTRDDVKPNVTRAEVNPMITRANEKHANTMFKPKGNVYDGYKSSESTTCVYGVKVRIMSKIRCYISNSNQDACSTKEKRAKWPKSSTIGKEVEVNEAQLDNQSVGIMFKWLKSSEKPDKCSKYGSDLYIYWCNFRDLTIFGKNYVVPTEDSPEVLIKLHHDPMSGHLGFDRTLEKSRQRFYWLNYRKELSELTNAKSAVQPKHQRLILNNQFPPLFALITQTAEEVAECLFLVIRRNGVPVAALLDQ
ncbi:Retrovirus-related Pol poly from transposon [Brachionus plicatilis]|uniref:Retrovirus-related Pol poly from transposon n=1 Tax=Brachionus plicatilis TaxID=10195 RepID=A0A3M7RLE5_BRAPC|nr:Retrovirus-related Pol poly from transposon [Brachionus plicatilis]